MTAASQGDAIAVFAPTDTDRQAAILCEEIARLGGRAVPLPATFLRRRKALELTITPEALVLGERLPPLGAVFLRGLALNVPAIAPPYLGDVQQAAWRARYLREQLRQRLLRTFCAAAEERGALIVNRPETYYHHDTKPQLARALHQAGLAVPPSVGTNDAGALASVAAGEWVFKAGQGVGATRALAQGHLANPARLRACPALFQQRIEGPTLRIHTVGSRVVLALEVVAATLDSRTSPQRLEVVELDEVAEAQLARANALLGSHFAAWDAIRTPAGMVLLDCNPGPYLGWIGERFARLVLHETARFLLAWCRTRSLEAASSAVRRAVDL
jgi:hypothetical protein